MPFKTNCPGCGKDMVMRESMFGKPKRCTHCSKLFRVGGGPVPTEAELAAYEAETEGTTTAQPARAKAAPVRIVVEEPIADVIPLAPDRPARRYAEPPRRPPKRGAPLWLVLLSLGLLLVGMGVAGFLVWKAVAERDEPSSSADSKKSNETKDANKREDDAKDTSKRDERKPPVDGGREDPVRPNPNPTQPNPNPMPKTSRLTTEKFRQLTLGMSEFAAVNLIRGPYQSIPSRIPDPMKPTRTLTVHTLTWTEGADTIQLVFVSGKLASGGAILGGMMLKLGE